MKHMPLLECLELQNRLSISPGLLDAMIKNDFEFAATNRKAILAEWQKRYDSKSEPKS